MGRINIQINLILSQWEHNVPVKEIDFFGGKQIRSWQYRNKRQKRVITNKRQKRGINILNIKYATNLQNTNRKIEIGENFRTKVYKNIKVKRKAMILNLDNRNHHPILRTKAERSTHTHTPIGKRSQNTSRSTRTVNRTALTKQMVI